MCLGTSGYDGAGVRVRARVMQHGRGPPSGGVLFLLGHQGRNASHSAILKLSRGPLRGACAWCCLPLLCWEWLFWWCAGCAGCASGLITRLWGFCARGLDPKLPSGGTVWTPFGVFAYDARSRGWFGRTCDCFSRAVGGLFFSLLLFF